MLLPQCRAGFGLENKFSGRQLAFLLEWASARWDGRWQLEELRRYSDEVAGELWQRCGKKALWARGSWLSSSSQSGSRHMSLTLSLGGLEPTGAGVWIDFGAVTLCCGLVSVRGLEIKSGNFPSHNASTDPRRICLS